MQQFFVTGGDSQLCCKLSNVPTSFDARVLTAAHADALRALTGPGGLPLLPCLHPALEEGQIVGDYAGQDELQAAAALLPLYAEDPLPTSLRAAGYGADGQGAVLTPPILREDYTQLRHFSAVGAALGHRAVRQLPYLGRAAAGLGTPGGV